jgi:hypothetical protein
VCLVFREADVNYRNKYLAASGNWKTHVFPELRTHVREEGHVINRCTVSRVLRVRSEISVSVDPSTYAPGLAHLKSSITFSISCDDPCAPVVDRWFGVDHHICQYHQSPTNLRNAVCRARPQSLIGIVLRHYRMEIGFASFKSLCLFDLRCGGRIHFRYYINMTYGRAELPFPISRLVFVTANALALALSFALQWGIAVQFGYAAASICSGFLINVLMSGSFTAMLFNRRGLRGQSIVRSKKYETQTGSLCLSLHKYKSPYLGYTAESAVAQFLLEYYKTAADKNEEHYRQTPLL